MRRLFPRKVSPLREYLEVLAVVAAVTVVGWVSPSANRAMGHVYLLAIIVLCLRVGRGPVLFAAIASSLAWLFVILPPQLSFTLYSFEDNLILGTYFVVAIIAGQLIARVRAQERDERHRLHRTLLDSVSHELKTPLAILRSASENLGREDRAGHEHFVGEIRLATDRLDHLVANLLNQTRLESGAVHPQLDWCDARDIIGAARRGLGDALAQRPLAVEIPAEMPLFRADAPLLEQAVANLLLNAALHTPPGTPVRVSAGADAGRERVFITVADAGPGIPAELRENLFQKFRRPPGARTGGLGLGLSIVHGFMQAHGGDVQVDDNPGGGARFTLHLPLAAHGSVPNE